jgi:hypothetical protein
MHFAHVKENVFQTLLLGGGASFRINQMLPNGPDLTPTLNIGEIVTVEGMVHVQVAK